MHREYSFHVIGHVESALTDPLAAPFQSNKEAPPASIIIERSYARALYGIHPDSDLLLLTWLHRADRDALTAHPRRDPTVPVAGVFATRSPHRPNPIGLHRIHVASIKNSRIEVRNLDALNGTPVIDLKPVIDGTA